MEDNKLKVKLKISLKDKEQMFGIVQPRIIEPVVDDNNGGGNKEVSDELEEGEIREDGGGGHDGEAAASKKSGTESSNKRVCPHCSRVFNGGKALGGHLRIHGESKSRPDGSGPGPAQEEEVYPCTLCGKTFGSEKALFGHMRSHPERDYRGMQIPGRRPVRVGWTVKGRRGQNGCAATVMAEEEEEEAEASSSLTYEEDERVAAEVLRHFTKCTTIIDNENEDGKKNNYGANMEAITKRKKPEFDEDELYFLKTYFELKTNLNSDDNNNNNNNPPDNNATIDSNNSVASTSFSKIDGVVRAKKRVKVIESINDDGGDDEEEEKDTNKELEKKRWECDVCYKTFPTHQALGGHKSSHSKEKEKDSGSDVGSGEEELKYKCKICDQCFASGQALGGHQRSHYIPSSTSLESSPEQVSSRNGPRDGGNHPFEFDLNLMAEDDVDGDGDGVQK